LTHSARIAGKDQLTDRHAAGVKAHDERGYSSWRHESASALYIGDSLGQGLAHIGSGMKVEFYQTDILNGFRFDVFNSGDVKKMILVVGDEIPFHLRGVHSAVWLGHEDDRLIKVGKNIDRHARVSEYRPQRNSYDGNQNSKRSSHRNVD